jgi:hypothetical protein
LYSFREELEAVQHPAGEIPLDRDAPVGRTPGPKASRSIISVSRRHAEVRIAGGKLFRLDAGSANLSRR